MITSIHTVGYELKKAPNWEPFIAASIVSVNLYIYASFTSWQFFRYTPHTLLAPFQQGG